MPADALRIPPRPGMVLGAGAADGLGELVRAVGADAAFVVSDRGLVAAGIVGSVVDGLARAGLRTGLFSDFSDFSDFWDVAPDPSVAAVAAGADASRAFGPAALVALGSGATIDAAKAIGLRAAAPGPCPPILAVPTTAGTGTETNAFAVIDDPDARCKRYVGHPSALPRYAVLDPALGLTVPPSVSAACGIDVLAHAIESIQARAGNAYAAALACEAARIVFAELPGVVRDGASLEGRASMLLAAHLAGLAFATTGLGTAHAIGHALSARHGSSHGRALAAVLAPVAALNAPERPQASARLVSAAGLAGALPEAVVRLQADVGLRPSLSELGVGDGDLASVADAALRDEVILNAPRIPSRAELLRMLEAVHQPAREGAFVA